MYVAVIRQIVLLLGVSSAVSLSSAANAADLPARPVATPGPQPLTAEWNRFYLSVHGGLGLLQDTSIDYVNGALERIILDYIAPWRNEISNFIADVVKSWDGPKVAEIIELEVGSDLQYIRINGTLVGAAIGMLLFLIGAAMPILRNGLAGWHF